MKRSRVALRFILFGVSLLVLFVLDILWGTVSIPFEKMIALFSEKEVDESLRIIVLKSRIPKAFTALLCGAMISLSGLLMQTFFRNPLAGPYILGISSGAGLGVAILIMGSGILGITIASSFSLGIAALIGAVSILFLLFLVSLKIKDIMTLLIFGVMIGAIATAFIGILQYLTSDYQLKSFMLWTLGSIEAIKIQELFILLAVLLIGLLGSIFIGKNLNTLLIGEDFAKGLGINTKVNRLLIILFSGALAGTVTAFCGPIGFIGIVVPHLCRLIFSTNNHFILIPAVVLLGANILLLSDILSHLPTKGISLPINSITSIIGIPFILWILFAKKSISKAF